MNQETSWMELHLAGVELERSRDKKNWYPIIGDEPYAGDNFWYRRKEKKDEWGTSHIQEQKNPPMR